MNIFYLSDDAYQSAQWMVDRHVVKMILESAQLLSTAHRVLDGTQTVLNEPGKRKRTEYVLSDHRQTRLYSATHVNHPSAVWVRASRENYQWLFRHFLALMSEYTYRYGKTHKCHDMITVLSTLPTFLASRGQTIMPSCMADEYIISDDPIVNYRNYYRLGKKHIHSWKNREIPDWI